ncbi:MAG: hypothetical protein ABS874_07190, partial [Lachnospiraceae bacterium]
MKERIVVAKFGGTSVADAGQVRKISDIVRSDPARRFIVVSAPGKRFSDDIKVTDLLLDLYEKAKAGEPFAAELRQIKMRFREIINGLGISFPLDEEFEISYSLKRRIGRSTGLKTWYRTLKLLAKQDYIF